jgi:hypothetical protein
MVMDNSDKVNFEKMVRATATMYTTVKPEDINTMMLKLFFASLSEFSFERVSYGFEQHLKDPVDGKFFPKPANIIKHLQTSEISTEDKATLAWSQVIREIRRTGSYGSLELDDKQALAAVKSLGSWQQLCNSTETEMTWKKKEFMSIYNTYEKTPIEFLPSSLPGRIELVEHKKEAGESMQRIVDGIEKFRLKNKGE